MAVPLESVRFASASDRSLLIYLGDRIAPETHIGIHKLLRLLELDPIAGIRNLHPAYCSLLVQFDPLCLEHDLLEAVLRRYVGRLGEIHLPEPRQVEIPVCYSEDVALDLHDVAALHNLAAADVVELHSSARYSVYFLGFVPGFAYLGGLPKELATPRLAKPRLSVPSGSVGIGGEQTGIYPFATPGGWRVIGRTPLAMFLPQRRQMSLLAIGDSVRFTPISFRRFSELEVAGGVDSEDGRR